MPFLSLPEVKLYYHRLGRGQALLFLHGLGGDHRQGLDLLADLNGYDCVLPDLRGHGQSRLCRQDAAFDMDALAGDAFSLLIALAWEQVIVVGLSLGAALSLKLALLAPERVRAMILIRPAWLSQPFPKNLAAFPHISDFIQVAGLEQGRALWLAHPLAQQLAEESPGCAASILGQFDREQAAESYRLLSELPESVPVHSLEELRAIPVPTLVIANDADPLHPKEMGTILAQHLPNAGLSVVPPRYVQPNRHLTQCKKSVADFLQKLDKPSRKGLTPT